MRAKELSKFELVTIAVGELGGRGGYIDREDIALAVQELAPGRFSWKKYTERIDLSIVETALRDAKKPKNGALLVSDKKGGWMLSPAGLEWYRSRSGLEPVEGTGRGRKGSVADNLELERVRLRTTQAFEKLARGQLMEITLQEFREFVRINEYFQTKARQRRFNIIDNAVAESEDLRELWSFLMTRFRQEFE